MELTLNQQKGLNIAIERYKNKEKFTVIINDINYNQRHSDWSAFGVSNDILIAKIFFFQILI